MLSDVISEHLGQFDEVQIITTRTYQIWGLKLGGTYRANHDFDIRSADHRQGATHASFHTSGDTPEYRNPRHI